MKTFGKGIFPGHMDPIQRDLLIVLMAGLLTATAFIIVGFLLFN